MILVETLLQSGEQKYPLNIILPPRCNERWSYSMFPFEIHVNMIWVVKSFTIYRLCCVYDRLNISLFCSPSTIFLCHYLNQIFLDHISLLLKSVYLLYIFGRFQWQRNMLKVVFLLLLARKFSCFDLIDCCSK